MDIIPFPDQRIKKTSPGRLRTVVALVAADSGFYSKTSFIPTADLLDYSIGKTVFVSLPSAAQFDKLIAHLPFPALIQLSNTGHARHVEQFANIYRRSQNKSGYYSIQKGKAWGTIINAWHILGSEQQPARSETQILALMSVLRKAAIPYGDLRSPGHVAGLTVTEDDRPSQLPEKRHLKRFQNSFRGARFEATRFGTMNVFDYDISAAYPHEMSRLPWTGAMKWVESTDLNLIGQADYAAVLCDIHITPTHRGPIAYRWLGELYYPVGDLRRCWLNLPELRLLADNPQLGKITKVIEGSWGIPEYGNTPTPFNDSLRRLYALRSKHPQYSTFIKAIMVSMYGKTASMYPRNKKLIASPTWNPVYSSAITSGLRARLYNASVNMDVAGEWADGLASPQEMPSKPGFGGFRLEGRGEMIIINDLIKHSAWKAAPFDIGLLREQKDDEALTIPISNEITLGLAVVNGSDASQIGQRNDYTVSMPIGAGGRLSDPLRVGDLLSGHIETEAPFADVLPLLSYRRQRQLNVIGEMLA